MNNQIDRRYSGHMRRTPPTRWQRFRTNARDLMVAGAGVAGALVLVAFVVALPFAAIYGVVRVVRLAWGP